MFNRRELLKAIGLGGGVIAGELWVPGQRKVFMPSGNIATERWQWFKDGWPIDGAYGRILTPEIRALIQNGHYVQCWNKDDMFPKAELSLTPNT